MEAFLPIIMNLHHHCYTAETRQLIGDLAEIIKTLKSLKQISAWGVKQKNGAHKEYKEFRKKVFMLRGESGMHYHSEWLKWMVKGNPDKHKCGRNSVRNGWGKIRGSLVDSGMNCLN